MTEQFELPTETKEEQALYTVTSVERIATYDSKDQAQDAMRVYYDVIGGGEHYVDVPLKKGWPGAAEKAIMSSVADIMAVLGIEGPPVTIDDNGIPHLTDE